MRSAASARRSAPSCRRWASRDSRRSIRRIRSSLPEPVAGLGFETKRLRLVPLTSGFADRYDAQECRAAEAHWRKHGFGHWALLDRRTDEFVGSAEVHFAYPGVEGISADEIEIGFEILPAHRRCGYAAEGVAAAVADTWRRTGAGVLVAYTTPGHMVAIRLLEKLGFAFRSSGTGRDGEPVSIYAVARPATPASR